MGCGQDFDLDSQHPKELWVRPLGPGALEQRRAEQLPVHQIAVAQDTKEEAAVAAHLPKLDLQGVTVSGDAAHTSKANCPQITQEQGGDYVCFLKGNQPKAFAKAKPLMAGSFPPSGSVLG